MALYLFDIDGTLLRGGISVHRDAFAAVFRDVYGEPLNLDGISAAGRTDTWLLAQPLLAAGWTWPEIAARLPQAFEAMDAYVSRCLGDLHSHVLPGVPEALNGLRMAGHILGLLTGNLEGVAFAKLRHAGLDEFFQTGGFGEESANRNDLVPVAVARTALQVGHPIPPREVVIVGDTPLDVAAGRAYGARTAAVATGSFSLSDLESTGADLVLPSLAAPVATAALLTLTSPSKS